jgi:hypothetical protein
VVLQINVNYASIITKEILPSGTITQDLSKCEVQIEEKIVLFMEEGRERKPQSQQQGR